MSESEDEKAYARSVLKGFLNTFENQESAMRGLALGLRWISEEVTDPLISTKLKNAAWQLNEEE
jgi:hypothetical protein